MKVRQTCSTLEHGLPAFRDPRLGPPSVGATLLQELLRKRATQSHLASQTAALPRGAWHPLGSHRGAAGPAGRFLGGG